MRPTGNHPGWQPGMLRQARLAAGLTVEELGEAIRELDVPGFRPPAAAAESIRRHENGRNWPGPDYRKAYQHALHRTADELGFRPAPADVAAAPLAPPGDASDVELAQHPDGGDHVEHPPVVSEEVCPLRRRDLLGAGVAVTVGAMAGDASSRAGQISRAMAASTPDPLTLAQLQQHVYDLVRVYDITPHQELIGSVERAWDDAEALLETRVSGTDRRDLELVAGQHALYRGRLAFGMNDDRTALTFFVLAGQHATAAGDSQLAGSVAVMRSMLAFFAGDFAVAANISRQAQPGAHPYAAAALAGGAARALALSGRRDEALVELRAMQEQVWTGDLMPGVACTDEEFCEAHSASILGYLAEGEQAERHARNSLALLGGRGNYRAAAGTHLALARAFLRRANPDPEQAAASALTAIDIVSDNESNTHGRAAGIWRHLVADDDWARLPAVRELGDRLPAAVHTLPRSSIV